MKMQLFTKVNHGNTILLKDRNFLKTFTRKRVNICFDFQGLEQENEEKLQLQPSQINISLLIVMEREGEGEGKKPQHSSCTLFISDPVNYCGEATRQGACEPNDPPGTVNTLKVSERSCVLSV